VRAGISSAPSSCPTAAARVHAASDAASRHARRGPSRSESQEFGRSLVQSGRPGWPGGPLWPVRTQKAGPAQHARPCRGCTCAERGPRRRHRPPPAGGRVGGGDCGERVAARSGHAAVAQALLAAGSSAAATDAQGRLPLHLACLGPYSECVQVARPASELNAAFLASDSAAGLPSGGLSTHRPLLDPLAHAACQHRDPHNLKLPQPHPFSDPWAGWLVWNAEFVLIRGGCIAVDILMTLQLCRFC
jgi:hypothetical protein